MGVKTPCSVKTTTATTQTNTAKDKTKTKSSATPSSDNTRTDSNSGTEGRDKSAVNTKNSTTTNTATNTTSFLTRALYALCFTLSAVLFVSRVRSNYVNYSGYLTLWSRAGDLIGTEHPIITPQHSTTQNTSKLPHKQRTVSVCTGSEWYQFPSHFTLPRNAKLVFLQDGFTGILPQHFAAVNGTSRAVLPLNDRNQEEVSRYVTLKQCDYVVLLVDRNRPENEWGWLRRGLVNDMRFADRDKAKIEDRLKIKDESGGRRFSVALSERVISSEFSRDKLSRAYFIPHVSEKTVKFQDYVLFRRERKEK